MDLSAVALGLVDHCPLCEAREHSLFERESIPPKEIHLLRCSKCEFIYTSAVVHTDYVPDFYHLYNVSRDNRRPDLREKRIAMYKLDGAYARRFLRPSDSRILDIGSGTGDFFAQFDSDFELHGVELDAAARAACGQAHPRIRLYPNLEAVPPNLCFDAIFFRGTLQYMPDLHGVAAWCAKRLRAGGRIFILSTPNAESLLAQLQRERWGLANKIEHRYWFARRHVLQLFGSRFTQLSFDLPYLGTPYEEYPRDLSRVLAMIDNAAERIEHVPFFGSMMHVVLERHEIPEPAGS